ncbi:uncharacterized protein LOC135843946 [Planococcus citri]|uniref:uncharacterized protein LOC135843946 n=1 Tax=Planococcus citri TaxID=170843 RepID=UPI0031F84DBA
MDSDLNSGDLNKASLDEDDLLKSPRDEVTSPSFQSPRDQSPNKVHSKVRSPSDITEESVHSIPLDKVSKKIARCLSELDYLYEDLLSEGEVADTFDVNEAEAVIKAQLESIKAIKVKYTHVHQKLRSYLDPDNTTALDEANDNRLVFLSSYRKFQFRLLRLLKPEGSSNRSDVEKSNSGSSYLHLKFPKFDLNNFDGTADEWLDWSRMYLSTVHNKNDISTLDKHRLLRSKLTGEAQILVKAFPIDEGSYKEVWDLLNITYGEPVKSITKYLKALDNVKPVSEDDPTGSLRSLITNFRANHTAIDLTLKEHPEIDGLSLIFSYLFLKKADQDTKVDWQREVARKKEYASFNAFLDYMNERCGALERGADEQVPTKGTKRGHQPHPSGVKKSLVVPEKKAKMNRKCGFCSEEHENHTCKTFLDMNAEDRLQLVKKKVLCFRCLRPFQKGHNKKCKFYCKTCKKGHNPLLHNSFVKKDDDSTNQG